MSRRGMGVQISGADGGRNRTGLIRTIFSPYGKSAGFAVDGKNNRHRSIQWQVEVGRSSSRRRRHLGVTG
jgi:hypothetical protein